MKFNIPEEVVGIAEKLEKAKFKAYLVGGCVRDILIGREPKDWDIATNAKPEETQKIFKDSVYENKFGTVGVKTRSEKENLKIVEITTFRLESEYTDKRHPDGVKFAKTIEEDLSRRDFTINALALNLTKGEAGEMIDPHGGRKDLENKTIKAVGNADERFNEDALRLMRAVRFATELSFKIEQKTLEAVEKRAGLLEAIAKERIRDEFVKIIMALEAARGILLLEKLGLLEYIIPELREGIGVAQNLHHIYTVFEHHIKSLDYAVKQNYSLEIRLTALLHDLGKPKTKYGEGYNATFHGHEMASAKMAARALERLRFSKDLIEKVVHLVRYHMFYYNVGEVSEAGVRRFLARVGPENIDDLLKIREADRIGSGTPKAVPYKNRHLLFMIEKVKTDPISPKMLKVDGGSVMKIAGIEPGPKVGQILAVLLEEVLDDPAKNVRKDLESRIKDLAKLSEKELIALAKKAKDKKEEFEVGAEEEMKKKYYVK
ncbi:MAG: HD domain-containing protein [Candidatus Paceibacterota bacterium]